MNPWVYEIDNDTKWRPWSSAHFGSKHVIEGLVHHLTQTTFVGEINIISVAVLQKMSMLWAVAGLIWIGERYNFWI